MRIKPFAFLSALSLLPLAAFAGDKPTNFKITMNDKAVGKTSYSLKKSGNKFQLNTRGDYTLPASGNDSAVSGDYKRNATLNSTYDLVQDATTNEVGTSRLTVYIAPSGGKLAIGAGGQGGGSSANIQLDLHPNTVVVPNFDAGAIEVLLRMHAALPSGAKMWSVLPAASIEVPVAIANSGAATGTFSGAPVALTRYTIQFPSLTVEAYADANQNLMRANFPVQHAEFTRDGFELMAGK